MSPISKSFSPWAKNAVYIDSYWCLVCAYTTRLIDLQSSKFAMAGFSGACKSIFKLTRQNRKSCYKELFLMEPRLS